MTKLEQANGPPELYRFPSASPKPAFRLETFWIPATATENLSYRLTLTNVSPDPASGFRLCVSGPGRIDPAAIVEGGTLVGRLSNHAEFAPPPDFVLAPGASWTVTVRKLSYPLRHWTDGATAAYLAFADGTTLPVAVAPTRASGDDAQLKRSAEIYPVPSVAPAPISVVPWPNNVAVTGRRATAPPGLALTSTGGLAAAAAEAFGDLVHALFPVEGIVRPAAEGGYPTTLSIGDGFGPEGYAIRFAQDGATLKAGSRTGLLYGLITLGQILRGARTYPETFVFPDAGDIHDEPALGWRGTHLDVARQFYSSAEIAQFLRILAWNKLNRFHWHLSDDEGWRVEIDAFPELAKVGAWRGHGLPVPALLGSGASPYGGYYSKAAIREVVAHAKNLGIEIVPEIDMPGHCFAALQALPWLRDPDEAGEYFSVQGFPNNCLNPAREETYRFVETVLDELIDLFPFKTIHVGADEVPLGAWSGSPQALAKLREVGGAALADAHARRLGVITNVHGADEIEGSGAAALQAEFLRRIQSFLASRGCITGGWEEAAHGNVIDKKKCYLNGWRTVQASATLAGEGYDIVVCPGQVYYLDMANGPEWSEPGAGWAGWSNPEKLYRFDPVEGWTSEQKDHLLGVQTCIWSEPMTDRAVFDRLVFPRISALAESGWTTPQAKSWERFKAMAGTMPVLHPREIGGG